MTRPWAYLQIAAYECRHLLAEPVATLSLVVLGIIAMILRGDNIHDAPELLCWECGLYATTIGIGGIHDAVSAIYREQAFAELQIERGVLFQTGMVRAVVQGGFWFIICSFGVVRYGWSGEGAYSRLLIWCLCGAACVFQAFNVRIVSLMLCRFPDLGKSRAGLLTHIAVASSFAINLLLGIWFATVFEWATQACLLIGGLLYAGTLAIVAFVVFLACARQAPRRRAVMC